MAPKSKSRRPTLYQTGTALWVIGIAIVIALVLIGSQGQLNQLFKGASLPSTNTSSQTSTLTAACTPISGSYHNNFGLNGTGSISNVNASLLTRPAGFANNPPASTVISAAGTCTASCDCDATLIPGPLKCPDGTTMINAKSCAPPSVPYKDSKAELIFATIPQGQSKTSDAINDAAKKALQAQCSAAVASLCSSACSTLPRLTSSSLSAAGSSLWNALNTSNPTASITCKPNPLPNKPLSIPAQPGF